MNSLKKKCNAYFSWGLILTLGMVLGIPAIVFSAINSWWFLLSIGIILVAGGFFSVPLIWTNYGDLHAYLKLEQCIVEDCIYSVNELASTLGNDERKIVAQIHYLFQNRYLTGFIFDGKVLKYNKNKTNTKQSEGKKCSNCGANLYSDSQSSYCMYCNTKF